MNKKIIYPELSYKVVGALFKVHNSLGCYAREKQYADCLEDNLIQIKLKYGREIAISSSGNTADFIIENKILLELKSVPRLKGDHYRQIQNYLQQSQLKLGILINFRNSYLKPIRIIRIDT